MLKCITATPNMGTERIQVLRVLVGPCTDTRTRNESCRMRESESGCGCKILHWAYVHNFQNIFRVDESS